jgi:hypothetical protein
VATDPARRRRALVIVGLVVLALAVAAVAVSQRTTAPSAASSTPVLRAGDTTGTTALPMRPDPAVVAAQWVASTGELLGMGPIRRSELLSGHVASGSRRSVLGGLEEDYQRLADRLPIPAAELRLLEVPLTVSATEAGEIVEVRVWSVVVFGAEQLGAPHVGWRTCRLQLVWEEGGWKLASFMSTDGPTPITGDALPAEWAEFVAVASWPPVVEGLS